MASLTDWILHPQKSSRAFFNKLWWIFIVIFALFVIVWLSRLFKVFS